MPPEILTRARLGFPQPEEDRDEEEAIHGRTDRADFAGRGDDDDRSRGSAAWGFRAFDLSVEAPVWADGGGGCARTSATPTGKRPAQEGLSRPRSRSGSDEGTAGKKVVTGATLQPTAKTKNDVWSWDFVHDVTTAGEPFRCVTVKDEATGICFAIEVDRTFSQQRVIAVLKRLLVLYGRPRYVRSNNGPELLAQPLLTFFKDQGITPSRMTPGKLWQNESHESFNGTLRRECLDAERFHSLAEAQVVIEDWRRQYHQDRPHRTLGYDTPATAYWGTSSRESEAGGFSDSMAEQSVHIIGREATIVDHPAPGGRGG